MHSLDFQSSKLSKEVRGWKHFFFYDVSHYIQDVLEEMRSVVNYCQK